MNMQNIPDKDLDKIFTQAAENYQAPFDSGAWQKMQQKLDKTGHAGSFWKRYILLILGIAIIPIAFVIFENTQHTEAVSEASGIENPSKQESLQTEISSPIIAEQSVIENDLPNRSSKISNSEHANEASITEPKTKDRMVSEKLKVSDAGGASSDNTINNNIKVKKFALQYRTALIPDSEILNNKSPLIIAVSPTFNNEEVVPEKREFIPHVNVAVGISPDISGLGFQSFSKPGAALGVFIGYQFSPRFSLITGISQARKIYSLREGFNPYEGYWGKYSKPDLINGECNVVDIPLNLRYDFISNEKMKLFISSGFSSYFMLTEAYDYFYNDYPQSNRGYEVANENQHYFGIINFSIGYEHRFSQKWSLQLEPIIKLPAAEVGVGNLPLMSAGAFFSLKYNFLNSAIP